MKKIWNILKKPTIILSALIVFQVTQLVYYLQRTESPLTDGFFLLRSTVALVVVAIAITALFEKKPALWIMGIYLLTFIIGIIIGLFKVPLQHYWAKTIVIVSGSYFTFGGWMLIQRARGKK